jgi:hypothetical protein
VRVAPFRQQKLPAPTELRAGPTQPLGEEDDEPPSIPGVSTPSPASEKAIEAGVFRWSLGRPELKPHPLAAFLPFPARPFPSRPFLRAPAGPPGCAAPRPPRALAAPQTALP